jgi:hypothetical protein
MVTKVSCGIDTTVVLVDEGPEKLAGHLAEFIGKCRAAAAVGKAPLYVLAFFPLGTVNRNE